MYCIDQHHDEDSWHEWDTMVKHMEEYRKEIIENLNKEFGGSNGTWIGTIMAQNYLDKDKSKYHISEGLWESFGFVRKEAYAMIEDGDHYIDFWREEMNSYNPND